MAKNKSWIQYTKQGQIVPGSLIVSPRRPVNGVWYEVITDICCDTELPFGLISSKQKAFVKYDASGNIVPGSLVLTDGRLPRPGIWKEVYIDICCSTTSTTTTTTILPTTTTTTTEGPPVPLPFVTIGDQIWSEFNLDVTTYRNGDPIPEVTDPTAWGNLTTGAWCYYANNSANGPIYGKLYNWYAVNDPRGLAPWGWHVPTLTEWNTLAGAVGNDGGALKTTTGWFPPNVGATNSSGFSAVPAGARGGGAPGQFGALTAATLFWTTTPANALASYVRGLSFSDSFISGSGQDNFEGYSIRLVQN
jgi:uncharacterized protein (TIGR02145 family)